MPDAMTEKERLSGPRIIIAGGATGGHLFPGIAIAEHLREERPACQLMFVSTGTAIEKRILSRTGFAFQRIATEGIKGRGLIAKARAVIKLAVGIITAAGLIRKFKPDMIIGMGSYSSAPMVIAGWLLGVHIALHEQNALPGITNRVMSRLADRVFVSFPKTAERWPAEKVRITGNPVRKEILRAMAEDRVMASADSAGFTVFVIGGSQGASRINRAVTGSLAYLTEKENLFFIHQTGETEETAVRRVYQQAGVACRVEAFFDAMAACYTKADLLICRAGATTVAEIVCLGKPAILVPFPYAADDHQTENARALVDAGGVEMIPERELTERLLAEKIAYYASHRAKLKEMGRRLSAAGKPEAGKIIAEECLALMAQAKKRRSVTYSCI
jgi:UDP-N-acetylglucosamine--N-acetylmuramyl-(pentapeptide) pyrophosphoryl-undecaprenol N-acetylglucosamine transferase